MLDKFSVLTDGLTVELSKDNLDILRAVTRFDNTQQSHYLAVIRAVDSLVKNGEEGEIFAYGTGLEISLIVICLKLLALNAEYRKINLVNLNFQPNRTQTSCDTDPLTTQVGSLIEDKELRHYLSAVGYPKDLVDTRTAATQDIQPFALPQRIALLLTNMTKHQLGHSEVFQNIVSLLTPSGLLVCNNQVLVNGTAADPEEKCANSLCNRDEFGNFFTSGTANRTSKNQLAPISTVETCPLISIIIPCYNYGHYLEEAVNSVFEQTYPNYEIIIVNDGSTDDTLNVANLIISKNVDKKIRLLTQENQREPAIARNKGILGSRGSFLLSLDADDILDPQALEKLLSVVAEDTVAFGNIEQFGQVSTYCRTSEFPASSLLYENQLPYCSLFSRSLWEKCGGFKSGLGYEDWEFWIACFSQGAHFRHVQQRIIYYRKHGDSIVSAAQSKHEWYFARMMQLHLGLYPIEDRCWSNWYLTTFPTAPNNYDFESSDLNNHPFKNTAARVIAGAPLLYSERAYQWAVAALSDNDKLNALRAS